LQLACVCNKTQVQTTVVGFWDSLPSWPKRRYYYFNSTMYLLSSNSRSSPSSRELRKKKSSSSSDGTASTDVSSGSLTPSRLKDNETTKKSKSKEKSSKALVTTTKAKAKKTSVNSTSSPSSTTKKKKKPTNKSDSESSSSSKNSSHPVPLWKLMLKEDQHKFPKGHDKNDLPPVKVRKMKRRNSAGCVEPSKTASLEPRLVNNNNPKQKAPASSPKTIIKSNDTTQSAQQSSRQQQQQQQQQQQPQRRRPVTKKRVTFAIDSENYRHVYKTTRRHQPEVQLQSHKGISKTRRNKTASTTATADTKPVYKKKDLWWTPLEMQEIDEANEELMEFLLEDLHYVKALKKLFKQCCSNKQPPESFALLNHENSSRSKNNNKKESDNNKTSTLALLQQQQHCFTIHPNARGLEKWIVEDAMEQRCNLHRQAVLVAQELVRGGGGDDESILSGVGTLATRGSSLLPGQQREWDDMEWELLRNRSLQYSRPSTLWAEQMGRADAWLVAVSTRGRTNDSTSRGRSQSRARSASRARSKSRGPARASLTRTSRKDGGKRSSGSSTTPGKGREGRQNSIQQS